MKDSQFKPAQREGLSSPSKGRPTFFEFGSKGWLIDSTGGGPSPSGQRTERQAPPFTLEIAGNGRGAAVSVAPSIGIQEFSMKMISFSLCRIANLPRFSGSAKSLDFEGSGVA